MPFTGIQSQSLQDSFKYIEKKKNKKQTHWKPYYWITFKLHTTLQVKVIRNHHDVKQKLKQLNARLSYTEWTDQEEDAYTSSLGFLIGFNPKHCTDNQAHTDTNQWIAKITETPIPSIPLWKPQLTISSVIHDGVTHQCSSFDFTCRTQDASTLRSLLEKTFTDKSF